MTVTAIGELPGFHIDDVKKYVNGKKNLNRLTHIQLYVDQALLKINLVPVKGNIGEGHYNLLQCPKCERPCRILRVYKGWLMCPRCLVNKGRKYKRINFNDDYKIENYQNV